MLMLVALPVVHLPAVAARRGGRPAAAILSLIRDFDPHVVTSDSGLASFYDRLVNTWPNVVEVMSRTRLDPDRRRLRHVRQHHGRSSRCRAWT